MPLKVTADPMRFDEAIEELRKRVPMTTDEWDQLESRARARAFTVAGVAQLDVINDTKQSLVDALELGKTFHEWKKDGAQERLENAWQGSVANPAARLETIYRTNLQTQYSRGHELQAAHPAIQRHRPYKRFVAAIDDDTTDVCREADGTILPADHPWWDSHTPPLHFNCRSTVETLSTEEAEELGITESPTELTAQEGFGEKPQTDPDPALEKWAAEKLKKVDAELAEIYRAKEEARVQPEVSTRVTARPEEPEGTAQPAAVAVPAVTAQVRSDEQAPRPAAEQRPAETESAAAPVTQPASSLPMPDGREPEQGPRWADGRAPKESAPWSMAPAQKPGTVDEGEGRRFRYEHERRTAHYLANQGSDVRVREKSPEPGVKNPDIEINGIPVELTSFEKLRKAGGTVTAKTVKSAITKKASEPQAEYLVIDARGTNLTEADARAGVLAAQRYRPNVPFRGIRIIGSGFDLSFSFP